MEINKLYFQDCKEILQQLPDNSITAYIQDPPFEVTANYWDKNFIKQLPELWELWKQKGKENAAFVFKATYPFAIDLINSNRDMFKYEWVWKKNTFSNTVNAKRMPMRCLEYLFIFYKEQPVYNPILRKVKHPKATIKTQNNPGGSTYNLKRKEGVSYKKEKSDFGAPVNWLDIKTESDRFVSSNGSQNRHPNRTNPELWEYFIKTYTNEGDLLFDGYAGSGSVEEAAIKLNRNWIACENSEEYFTDTEINLRNKMEVHKLGYAKTTLKNQLKPDLFSGLY